MFLDQDKVVINLLIEIVTQIFLKITGESTFNILT